MATQVLEAPPPTGPEPLVAPPPVRDAWPHTERPMPWLVALFMVMVYLLPFDSIVLPISLPFNAGLDRVVLVAIALVWLFVSVSGSPPPRFKHGIFNLAIYAFVVISVLSLVVNLRDLSWDQELSPSFKQLLLTFSYLLFFFVAASSLTREDFRGFCKFLVILAAISGLGTIYEFRTQHNLFADLANLIPGARVHVHTASHGIVGARFTARGPTKHGLSDATLLVAAIPFAMAFLTRARTRDQKLGWGLALLVLITTCVATQEKTALIVLVVSIVVTVLYAPRRYARFWPLLVVAVIVTRVAAPHSISSLMYQFRTLGSSNSTSGRTSDYSAVAPFINTHLLFGRGFGSFDPHKYRILDNQMLGLLIEIGVFGLLSYVAVIFAPLILVHRRARRSLNLEDDLLAGIAAGCVAFFVSNFLYDAFSFRQGPYVFFFLAALAASAMGRVTADPHVPFEVPDPVAHGLPDPYA